MTDLTKLKELAELASKATPGPWWIDSHGHCMVSESQDHRTVFLTNDGMGPATRHPETGNLSHWPNDWDASYIASADPTTILELIAEVDRLRKQVDMLINQHMPREPIPEMPGWSRVIDAERIKAENDHLRNGMKGDYDLDAWLDWAQEKGRLKAENEALRKDAERYQALRQKDRGGVVVRDRTSHLFGENLDAAIDAALEGGGR